MKMAERAKKEFLPSINPEWKRFHYQVALDSLERKEYLLPLEHYLSSQEKWASLTDGNPDLFSAHSIEEAYKIFDRTFTIKESETREGGFTLYNNEECKGVGHGYLDSTALDIKEKEDSCFLEARMYEKVFDLPEGTFKIKLASPCNWRVDGESKFQDYWHHLLENNTPFVLMTLGKLGEIRGMHQNMGETYLINGIDIYDSTA